MKFYIFTVIDKSMKLNMEHAVVLFNGAFEHMMQYILL